MAKAALEAPLAGWIYLGNAVLWLRYPRLPDGNLRARMTLNLAAKESSPKEAEQHRWRQN